jgi:lysyl endopeptidase
MARTPRLKACRAPLDARRAARRIARPSFPYAIGLFVCGAASFLVPGRLAAQQAEPRHLAQPVGEPIEKTAAAPSPDLVQALAAGEERRLRTAREGAGDQLDAMAAWNARGRLPIQIGFARRLPAPIELRPERSSSGTWVWGARVRVPQAFRLRLHLEEVALPAGSRLWVWGSGGAGDRPRPFGTELSSPGRDLWTPSVAGDTIALGAELPAGEHAALRVTEVAQIFALASPELGLPAKATSCLIDATCVKPAQLSAIDQLRTAVAHIEFMKGTTTFLCTGNLLNQKDPAVVVPYLLTANHCISDQGVAASLEAFWDYHTDRCNGTAPDLNRLPTSSGSTLQVTSVLSDFSLLKLNSIPAGRTLLGWKADGVGAGTSLYRVSHPVSSIPFSILPQTYSTSVSTATPHVICETDRDGRPWGDLTKFIYSAPASGGTAPGSSGSAVVESGGYVVGQLLGLCGDSPTDGCAGSVNSQVDGALSASFAFLAPYLDPKSTAPCSPDANTLCIDDQTGDRRFKVVANFSTTSGGGRSGNAGAVGLGSLGVNHGGLFWFFSADNPELLVKVLNACSFSHTIWVFLSATTNVGFSVTVTDTQTGHVVTHGNPDQNPAAPVQDTSALPCG